MRKTIVLNDDIFDLTPEEYKKLYNVTDEEYEMLVKQSQEM